MENEETDNECVIRSLEANDLDAIVKIDAHWSGRERREFFARKIDRALEESAVRISLGAEVDGLLVGFVLASVFYGEFGKAEPFATIDTIGIHPQFLGRGTAKTLWTQLAKNAHALGVDRMETEVRWNDWQLLKFFEHVGFRPSDRICLEASLDPRALDGEEPAAPA